MSNDRSPLSRLPGGTVYVAPSILAADFARLGEQVRDVTVAGADLIHVDIMDGHFVPNLSMGPAVVGAIRDSSELPFDVHLMLSDPGGHVDAFIEAGADHVTVHVEIGDSLPRVLDQIRRAGCSVGLSLRPATPASDLAPYLQDLDLILVMTVEPGFGGQVFRQDVVPKIREIRKMVLDSGRPVHVEVDGGISSATAGLVCGAGANMLVAGTSIFRAPEGMARAITELRGVARK